MWHWAIMLETGHNVLIACQLTLTVMWCENFGQFFFFFLKQSPNVYRNAFKKKKKKSMWGSSRSPKTPRRTLVFFIRTRLKFFIRTRDWSATHGPRHAIQKDNVRVDPVLILLDQELNKQSGVLSPVFFSTCISDCSIISMTPQATM